MSHRSLLALDVGTVRVGVAMARAEVRVPVVLPTLSRQDEQFWEKLKEIIMANDIKQLVVGLPRGLDGQETEQTKYVKNFVDELAEHISLPVALQDEALTSVQAEASLAASRKSYQKSDVDGVSASLILGDYLEGEHKA